MMQPAAFSETSCLTEFISFSGLSNELQAASDSPLCQARSHACKHGKKSGDRSDTRCPQCGFANGESVLP
jgi:hypothetical protein